MKIQSREIIKGNFKTTVLVGSKVFVRFQKNLIGASGSNVIEWRNKKTNCLVKADKHKALESQFETVDTTYQLTKKSVNIISTGKTMSTSVLFNKEKSHKEQLIDNKVIELCETGTMLMAVKYYKEMALVGLKESRDYVFALWDEVKKRKDVEVTFMKPELDATIMKTMNNFFPNNASRKMFISEAKKVDTNSGVLATIKFMREKTGWGLYDSKMFYDNIIKMK